MQPMQAFTAGDPYQTSRCAAAGNLGIGTIVSTGVHGNAANYNNFTSNYIQDDPGMTRIVFNGNNARNDFHCGTDNFQQNCIAAAGELLDNSANYQLNFVNSNNGNMRYMRQQMNPPFLGDQMQRCYVQRTQGPQGRFVRVQQGNKMRPPSYRNFNNQQRQKQNRRYITKGFNNYKNQSNVGTTPTDGYFEENVTGCGSLSSPPRFAQPHAKPMDKEARKGPSGGRSKLDTQASESTVGPSSSKPMDSFNRSNNACINGGKLLEPKVEYVSEQKHNLSYDDVSENSDGNDDSDLRERLSRKFIKREPGELDSEEDEAEIRRQKEASSKRKSKKKHGGGGEDGAKKHKISGPSSSSNERDGQTKEMKRPQKSGKNESGKGSMHGSYSPPPYSCHDNRCSTGHKDNKVLTECTGEKSHCPGPGSYGSTYSDCTGQTFGCPDADEVVELKDKISSMKQSLRDAQDKLLEANVVGSKKALRMQEEISKLKNQLEESSKKEIDLKTSLKNVENELSVKNTELTKMKLLSEIEKQDKAKLNAEMSRTYKERLSIEVEKLRALFDVEVAKMQTFYMSSNVYGDETGVPFQGGSLDQNQNPLPNCSNGSSRSHEMNPSGENRSHATSDVNGHGHHEIPFLHNNYFDSSSHAGAATPFSLYENVLAYNSLVRHHHIYPHNMPSRSASANSSENGNNMGNGCGSNSAI